ncbi:hypothetical protein H4R33_001379 [Dimargaris cristalligena]|nr:hypothetical protein H4R33_001379 [Dimargaris cristalligena]
MVDQGRAEWLDDKKTSRNQCLIYWHSPEEWADLIYQWIQDRALNNSVLTLYELTHDDLSQGAEFHGMDALMLRRVLSTLVSKGKAQVFHNDEAANEAGVKFF